MTPSAYHNDDDDCQDDDDRLRSANIYCFRVELSAEGAKRDVETPPEVFPPYNLPRPSRSKAGLGLVMMMMMMLTGCWVALVGNTSWRCHFPSDAHCPPSSSSGWSSSPSSSSCWSWSNGWGWWSRSRSSLWETWIWKFLWATSQPLYTDKKPFHWNFYPDQNTL